MARSPATLEVAIPGEESVSKSDEPLADTDADAHVDADVDADRELERRVLLRLLRSGSLANAEVDVDSAQGVVQLSGRVGTERALATARRIAERTFGVHGIESDLRIDPELADIGTRRDEAIAREAAQLLASLYPSAEARDTWLYGWEIRGDGWEIELDVDHGAVMLSGSVPTRADISRCVVAAHGVDGVRRVFSDLGWVDRQGADALPYPRGYYPYGYPPSHPLGAYPYPWDWSATPTFSFPDRRPI